MHLFYNKLLFKLFIVDILLFSGCSTCTHRDRENLERKNSTNLNIITTPPINKEDKKLDKNKKATSQGSHQQENEEKNKKDDDSDDSEQAINVLQTQIKEIENEIEAKEKLVNYKVQELSKSDEITAGTIQRIKQNLEDLRIIDRSTENVDILYEKILEVIESINSQNNISENLRSAINDLEIDIKYLQELDVKKSRTLLQEQINALAAFEGALVSKDKLRKEKAQEIEARLEAERKTAEKKAEIEQLKKENEDREKEKEELKKNSKAQFLNIAKSMLQFGMPIEQIVQATGLSREEIEQINNN